MKQVIPFKKDIIFKSKIAEITSISLEHSLSLEEEDMISGDFIISGDYKMTEASINKEAFSYNLPFDIALDSRYDTKNLKIEIQDFYYEIINDDILRVNIEVLIDGLEDKPFREEIETIDFENENTNQEEINELKDLDEEKEEDESLIEITNTIEELKRQLDEKNNNLYNLEKLVEEKEKAYQDVVERNAQVEVKEVESVENEIPILETQTPNINVDTKEIKSLFGSLNEDETFSTYHVYIMREEDTIDKVITKYNTSKEILSKYNDIENIQLGDKIIIPAIIND